MDNAPQPLLHDENEELLRWYYEQNLAMANIFFEWRHKLLALGVGGASVLAAVSVALPAKPSEAQALPAGIGFCVALAVVFVNRRFATILRETYAIGHLLEEAVIDRLDLLLTSSASETIRGPFAVLADGHRKRTTEPVPEGDSRSPGRPRLCHSRSRLPTFTTVINVLAAFVAVVCASVAAWTVVR